MAKSERLFSIYKKGAMYILAVNTGIIPYFSDESLFGDENSFDFGYRFSDIWLW